MVASPLSARRKQAASNSVRGRLTVHSDRGDLVIPPSAYEMEGFREWATADDFPEKVRVTFLDGEIFLDMSNEEINAHVLVKTELIGVLSPLVKKLRLGMLFCDGMLVTNAKAGVSNNPVACFVSKETMESGRAKPVPRKGAEHLFRELEGSPDWVVEVVSDGSVKKDTSLLRAGYHRANVSEYWLIDARGDQIKFEVLERRKNDYAAAPSREGWQRSKVFGRSFRFVRRLNEFGLWDYTLEVAEA